MMTQTPKNQKTETFQVVGVAQDGRSVQNIYDDIVGLVQDLHDKIRCASSAEAIMHMCADIIVMSKVERVGQASIR